jgi:hypothetical protein
VSYLSSVLFQYSEWLDGEGLIRSELETGDNRTHENLVDEFLEAFRDEKTIDQYGCVS